jgi:hypothetical protein
MITLPSWVVLALQVNAVLGTLIFYRIYTQTRIMRQKDDLRDQIYHSSARLDAQHWNMSFIFVMCVTLLIPRVIVLILTILLEYLACR